MTKVVINPYCELRHVKIEPYTTEGHYFTLQTWDTHKRDGGAFGRCYLRYEFKEFYNGQQRLLFEGEDFSPSPMTAIDSDDALRCLLGFLTLRPGDTDEEYFENYTKDQMDFAETDAEELQMWSIEPDDEMEEMPFINLDDWDDEEARPDMSHLKPRRW